MFVDIERSTGLCKFHKSRFYPSLTNQKAFLVVCSQINFELCTLFWKAPCDIFYLVSNLGRSVMEGFKARDIGIRAQKKILGRMATKNVAKVFIDDTSASLLDNIYKLAKTYTGNKKQAEKLVKNIIKIVIKVAVLYRNNQFNNEEMKHADRFKQKFHSAAMAVISFYEVDFSYDRLYLLKQIRECSASLLLLVQRHLTDKSITRISQVFDFFSNPQFLDAVFKKDTEYYEILGKIVSDMNTALDSGDL